MEATTATTRTLSDLEIRYFNSLMAKVPERYRGARLHSLKPCEQSCLTEARQLQVYSALQEYVAKNPDVSVCFYGPPGTGKTYLMAALFARVAGRATSLMKCAKPSFTLFWEDLGLWQQRTTDYQFGRTTVAPTLTPSAIVSARAHDGLPCLFLDEFDKVDLKRRDTIDVLIRAAYEGRCRIVMATNFTQEQFREQFDDHIFRRLDQDGAALHVNLFEGVK